MIKELEEYRDYLQYQKNYSLYTVENYCSDIVQFLDYLNSESINFKSLQYSDLRFYLMYLKDEKGENNSSIGNLVLYEDFINFWLMKELLKIMFFH